MAILFDLYIFVYASLSHPQSKKLKYWEVAESPYSLSPPHSGSSLDFSEVQTGPKEREEGMDTDLLPGLDGEHIYTDIKNPNLHF